MTSRESLHQIGDMLPEERLSHVLDYLAELNEPEEPLSAETKAAIAEGLNDVREGRTISLSEYKRTRGQGNITSGFPAGLNATLTDWTRRRVSESSGGLSNWLKVLTSRAFQRP